MKDFWFLVLESAIFQPTFPSIRVDVIKNLMKYALIEHESIPFQNFAIMCFSSFLSRNTM